jgi:hypothetical protein
MFRCCSVGAKHISFTRKKEFQNKKRIFLRLKKSQKLFIKVQINLEENV